MDSLRARRESNARARQHTSEMAGCDAASQIHRSSSSAMVLSVSALDGAAYAQCGDGARREHAKPAGLSELDEGRKAL